MKHPEQRQVRPQISQLWPTAPPAGLEHLGAVFAAMDVGVIIQGSDGVILGCNAAAEHILGLTLDQLRGGTSIRPDWCAVREDGSPLPVYEHPAMIALATGRPLRGIVLGVGAPERRWIHVNAQPIPGPGDGPACSVVTSFSDITELRRRDAERHRALRQLEQFFLLSLDLLCLATPAGRFLRLNPAFTSVLGWSEQELLARPFFDLVHPDDVERTQQEAAHLGAGGVTVRFENRYRCKGGGWRHLQWSAALEPTEGVLIAAARDVTVLRERQAELTRAREAAEAADRAKSEFLATMSHEIRTPMNGVIGAADLLLDSNLNAVQADSARTIRDSGRGLLTILNDILDYSKIEAGRMELEQAPFAPATTLGDVVALLGPQAKAKGLDLTLAVASGAPAALLGDAGRLAQVLSNLIGNALKFTHQGGVTCRLGRCDPRQGLPGGGCVIEISDTGIGIAPAHRERLFQRFSQVDASMTRRYGGTGLGLAISGRLVSAMGGAIEVESEEGRGTTFRVTLPLPEGEVTAPVRRPSAAPRAPGRRLRVLLAEDNEVNQMVARAMLERLGHVVQIAANGVEAVAAFQRGGFDVVLMDVQMPVLDGLAATRMMRELEIARSAARTPVLALTANAMHEQQGECLAAGVDEVVTKPVTRAALEAALARWL